MKVKSPRLWTVTLLVSAGIIAVLAITLRPTPQVLPPVLLLPDSYNSQLPIPLFARWVPATQAWAWLWQLKEFVSGKIKPIEIDTDIVELSQITTPVIGAPTFESASSQRATLRVWRLQTADLNSLRQLLRTTSGVTVLNSPRIITGDGIGAGLYAGQTMVHGGVTNETGVWVNYFTRVHREALDLTASITLVEPLTNDVLVTAVQTNLNLRARFQIPIGKGIFLLQTFPHQANRNAVGVAIWTKP